MQTVPWAQTIVVVFTALAVSCFLALALARPEDDGSRSLSVFGLPPLTIPSEERILKTVVVITADLVRHHCGVPCVVPREFIRALEAEKIVAVRLQQARQQKVVRMLAWFAFVSFVLASVVRGAGQPLLALDGVARAGSVAFLILTFIDFSVSIMLSHYALDAESPVVEKKTTPSPHRV